MIEPTRKAEISYALLALSDLANNLNRHLPYLELLFDERMDMETHHIILSHYTDASRASIKEIHDVIQQARSLLEQSVFTGDYNSRTLNNSSNPN